MSGGGKLRYTSKDSNWNVKLEGEKIPAERWEDFQNRLKQMAADYGITVTITRENGGKGGGKDGG